MLGYIFITIHDVSMMMGAWQTANLLTPYSAIGSTLFLAFVMAWRFRRSQNRIAHFNEELQNTLLQSRRELSETLHHHHELVLEKTILQERLQLARDLHDGLGSSLVRAITTVEQSKHNLNNTQFLSMLKLLRNDLRQIIDSGSSSGIQVPETPVAWLAPLRHRFIQLFDEMEIDSYWRVPPVWEHPPNSMQCLTLSRVAEEAMTNIIKHSHASEVNVYMHFLQRQELVLVIEDNGVGFDVKTMQTAGVGMRSMRARLQKVGGDVDIVSHKGLTRLHITMKLPVADHTDARS